MAALASGQRLLRKLDGRHRPLAFVALDRDAKAVELVQPKPVDRAGFAIGQNDGLSNKLSLSPIEFGKDRAGAEFCGRHGVSSRCGGWNGTQLRHALIAADVCQSCRARGDNAAFRGGPYHSAVMPRFKRGIQYSRGLSCEHSRLWNT